MAKNIEQQRTGQRILGSNHVPARVALTDQITYTHIVILSIRKEIF